LKTTNIDPEKVRKSLEETVEKAPSKMTKHASNQKIEMRRTMVHTNIIC
jgi:hypothetical protein